MRVLRYHTVLIVASLGLLFLTNPSPLAAAEKTIALKGRVDVSGLKVSPGRFTVRALLPQKRTVKLGQTTTDSQGRFRLKVKSEALDVFGIVLEATSERDPTLGLEAAVLRLREAKEIITITPATTVESAILYWKVRRHSRDFDLIRPHLLYRWLRPIILPKTRKGLKRAELALVKWAREAGEEGSRPASVVVRASMGDLRQMRKRLAALGVPTKKIDEMEKMVRADAELAYILMMPYLLEL